MCVWLTMYVYCMWSSALCVCSLWSKEMLFFTSLSLHFTRSLFFSPFRPLASVVLTILHALPRSLSCFILFVFQSFSSSSLCPASSPSSFFFPLIILLPSVFLFPPILPCFGIYFVPRSVTATLMGYFPTAGHLDAAGVDARCARGDGAELTLGRTCVTDCLANKL